jgi:hypothetical protein
VILPIGMPEYVSVEDLFRIQGGTYFPATSLAGTMVEEVSAPDATVPAFKFA